MAVLSFFGDIQFYQKMKKTHPKQSSRWFRTEPTEFRYTAICHFLHISHPCLSVGSVPYFLFVPTEVLHYFNKLVNMKTHPQYTLCNWHLIQGSWRSAFSHIFLWQQWRDCVVVCLCWFSSFCEWQYKLCWHNSVFTQQLYFWSIMNITM